jgi:(1->4)-alpha-D-glucan 1-alpha-D-glucosylmutase
MNRIPTSTYRFQFNKSFTFAQARELVPYLRRLGISDLYASPIFKARQGSLHGYDATDPTQFNPELGTEQEFEELAQELQSHQMGLLLDIVPNHMAANPENPWWVDLLENGPSSPYADFFDIDWDPPGSMVKNQVVLPILGKPYYEALESGELTLALDQAGLHIRYYDNRLPLEIKSYGIVLSQSAEALISGLGASHPALTQLQQLTADIEGLPSYYCTAPDEIRPRHRSGQEIKERLLSLVNASRQMKQFLDDNLTFFNGQQGAPQSFDPLDWLLSQQPYQLLFWETGREVMNYRRFFDITDLVGVRVEVPHVFEATHRLALRLAHERKVTGLRIDHIDGLYDPLEYLRQLQAHLAPNTAEAGDPTGFYVVVEKILSDGEALPEDWPTGGTSGYDFLNALNAVFVDQSGFEQLVAVYHKMTGSSESFADVVYAKKKQVILELFHGEAQRLGHYLARLAQQDRYACDLPQQQLTQALREVAACLPVYRTYTRAGEVSKHDRRYVEGAVAEARARSPQLEGRALDFVKRALLGDWPAWLTAQQREVWSDFVSRWQQFTGPAMAKGFEDTSLYVYNPLISLNEVGGDPTAERLSVEAFHQHNAARQSQWPHTLNATSTHDTKRSEDVRARINVLSEIPDEWARCLNRWSRWNRARKSGVAGQLAPDASMESLLYQTLVGGWPLDQEEAPQFKERLKEYLLKAAREAKAYTSWLAQNRAYEDALLRFADSILEDAPDNRFLADFLKLQKRIAYYGAFNSLSQVLLKITSPGVPDLYQGTELWDFSLVDPDNRRPADFARRARLLDEITQQEPLKQKAWLKGLMDSWEDGRIKLYVTYQALRWRKEWQEVFSKGGYVPVEVEGHRKEHICAFARRHGEKWALVVAPRLLARLARPGRPPLGKRVWGEDSLLLPEGVPEEWLNGFTGDTIQVSSETQKASLSAIFDQFPVALLLGTVGGL